MISKLCYSWRGHLTCALSFFYLLPHVKNTDCKLSGSVQFCGVSKQGQNINKAYAKNITVISKLQKCVHSSAEIDYLHAQLNVQSNYFLTSSFFFFFCGTFGRGFSLIFLHGLLSGSNYLHCPHFDVVYVKGHFLTGFHHVNITSCQFYLS